MDEKLVCRTGSRNLVPINVISSYLSGHGLRAPSFAADNAVEYPAVADIQRARLALAESLMDMLHLAIGGSEFIFTQSMVVCCSPR
ncbi:hypothetical protein OIDMADRAFT_20024 [Oidiodendron maius Zn]|uniref:Uncharacterized protein n=1 Tax=Oidiodendron maius (strain Zn) TaxID=913774 RepID=A0A0C3HAM7_OIDMZ|nr:hypothetical protein OIDMADRAFT_20024 [Oidiodendron maius Zn]